MPIESLNSRNTSTSSTNRSAAMPSTWMLTSLRADVPTASPAVNIMADAMPRASSGLETAPDHGDRDKSNDHAWSASRSKASTTNPWYDSATPCLVRYAAEHARGSVGQRSVPASNGVGVASVNVREAYRVRLVGVAACRRRLLIGQALTSATTYARADGDVVNVALGICVDHRGGEDSWGLVLRAAHMDRRPTTKPSAKALIAASSMGLTAIS
jgi:hypothetical protein